MRSASEFGADLLLTTSSHPAIHQLLLLLDSHTERLTP